MNNIAVFCLGHRRPSFFIAHAKELAKCSYKNFHFFLLASAISQEVINEIVSILGEKVTIKTFGNSFNYMSKIKDALNTSLKQYDFAIKQDEDCFMTSKSWDRFFELSNNFEDNDLMATGALSSGIPTTEFFIENHTPEIKNNIFNDFCNTKIGTFGIDYSSLNEDYKEWDKEKFYTKVKNFNHYYKGIHPIRVNFEILKKLNDFIIDNFSKVMTPKKSIIIKDKDKYPYLCNSIFMIRPKDWEKIINDPTLYVDDFDEVPLNRYRDNHNKNLIIDPGIPMIHTMYNWTPNWDYENHLIEQICLKAAQV